MPGTAAGRIYRNTGEQLCRQKSARLLQPVAGGGSWPGPETEADLSQSSATSTRRLQLLDGLARRHGETALGSLALFAVCGHSHPRGPHRCCEASS
jgi:hypothetical protein